MRFVLSGTVVCGHCGGAYIGNTGTSRNKTKVRYYSCVTDRRYGKAACASPTLPADDLERLVSDALVATYADTEVFCAAIEAHLAERRQSAGPLQSELDAVRSTLAAKERLPAKYRDDYEADRLPADLYAERTAELREDRDAALGRAAELELQLAQTEGAPVPSDADRAALHALLAERIHTGPVPVRKALFTALVERLEVHALTTFAPPSGSADQRWPASRRTPSGPWTAPLAHVAATAPRRANLQPPGRCLPTVGLGGA